MASSGGLFQVPRTARHTSPVRATYATSSPSGVKAVAMRSVPSGIVARTLSWKGEEAGVVAQAESARSKRIVDRMRPPDEAIVIETGCGNYRGEYSDRMAKISDAGESLLRAYSASARINQYLAERLNPAVWREGSGRTIAALFAHMHNCGLRYLQRTDPKAAVPAELDRFTVTPVQAVRAFGAKRKAVERIVGSALADGRRIAGFGHDAATYLAYYLSHDSHHRGQITLLTRQLGHPLDQETMSGMWQWSPRAKE